ncbi:hypothetical protein SAMN04488502_11446 [Dendrosporobacter quercicolus]|uniref:Uncharacterized protein n=1 Tax=Dendrosporobacter quercicolus TaxID=146817 RepID=A0A1G9ZFD7_9FIRM|nr:hypothetical protein [Dendrosporobacter quercicolus]SDN20132.1 hypothetical protein SAMN04488502_11446 [Dendrosporobacter quercicolus]
MVKILVYLAWMGITFGLMAYMIFRRFKNTLHGRPESRYDRLKYFLTNVVAQDKVIQDHRLCPCVDHVGFIVLGFGALNLAVEGLFGVPVPFIGLKELFLLLVYTGVIVAVLRRTVLKPDRINNTVEAFVIVF